MTLLKDLATVFFTRYGYTHREGIILMKILNYWHEYEEDIGDSSYFNVYYEYDKDKVESFPREFF